MAIKGPLERIAKWLERDEWREAFAAAVTEHIGEACAAAEIEPEDIPEMIDEDAHADLMHCILFDFMTRRIGPDQAQHRHRLPQAPRLEGADPRAPHAGSAARFHHEPL